MNEVFEVWYFKNHNDLQTEDKTKAIGYTKTINGTLADSSGKITKYLLLKGHCED